MLINLSNHPSSGWGDQQLSAAKQWGKIIDLPFPTIDPGMDDEGVRQLATEYLGRIDDLIKREEGPHAIHLMGEHTFCFVLATLLQQRQITCVVATTHRQVTYDANGDKVTRFGFVQFRPYPKIG
ncbi:hypothetical protein [Thermophagus xiamenensis]|uniref:CRISPR-associated protein n=1 Tax=Thermophagus xiamenensis TaxID=385682 RepID=A0A1I1VD69_9BACT|nr:hypothetical protein [Thermophagus xiamenensis]SFD80705.1 hypothetical protein SAMN05444380_102125 [Thermophagus xiamenensis]